MTIEHNDLTPQGPVHMAPSSYLGTGIYDNKPIETSTASAIGVMYGGHNTTLLQDMYPVHDPATAEELNLIPIEFQFDRIYETRNYRKVENMNNKIVSQYALSRRRAQNRAAQRAFRERKDKRAREAQESLMELQGQYSELTQSYEALRIDFVNLKQELDALRRKHVSASPKPSRTFFGMKEWESCQTDTCDPSSLEISSFF